MMNMKSNNVASQDELRSVSDIINLIYTNLSATIICDCLSENRPNSHLPVFREISF